MWRPSPPTPQQSDSSDVYLTQSITLAHHLQLSPAHFIIDGNDYDLQILRNTSLIVGSPLQYKHHMYTLLAIYENYINLMSPLQAAGGSPRS